MDLVGGIVVFIISWWLSFFVVLPIGVKGQFEDGGEVIEGSEEGAPKEPMIRKKVIWASIGAVGLTLIAHFFVVPWLAAS
jgi:predicted secreted protein